MYTDKITPLLEIYSIIMKKFSVLISVYACEQSEHLRAALHSVFKQTVLPAEVVLVEDGPLTPELDAVIFDISTRYDTMKIVKLAKNMGLGNALNVGLSVCTYDLVARMDSDDLSLPGRFEAQLRVFEKYPEVSVVGGWISEFDNDPQNIVSYRRLPQTDRELKQICQLKNPLNHMTVMFRKKDVLDAGGYQHFYLFEDYWLWVRMIKNGVKFYNVQEVLVNVRSGIAMARRRGGLKYAKSEIRFQRKIWQIGLISLPVFLRNVCVRFSIRMMPNTLRSLVYEKVLR